MHTMKKIIDFLETEILGLIIIILCATSCNKDNDLGEQPYELNDSLNTSIQLKVSGFENLDGNLAIAIFNDSDAFNNGGQTYKDSILSINSYEMDLIINNIENGEYAISLFHDYDKNGELTTSSLLGFKIPQEGFGFSNNPNIGFSQPTYDECKFTVIKDQTLVVPIDINYL
tara:strand:+ start:152 stop:667 length:516 start_codon:yes stop_codon:yes gene_type:complete